MKLSEAIANLETLKAEHGDLDLLEDTADGCLPVYFYVDIVVDEEDGNRTLTALVGVHGSSEDVV